jgi:type VI secretion system protein ImpA
VITECERLLRGSTKDLRLAVWLTDALGSQRGFAGLADGYRLVAGLCERYWPDMHPMPEDGDIESRLGSVAWLVGRTVQSLEATPIVDNGSMRHGAGTWRAALDLAHQVKRAPDDADDLRRGKTSIEEFDRVRLATPTSLWLRMRAELLDCRMAITHFEHVFDEKTRSAGASFGAAREALEFTLQAVERFAREAGASWDTAPSPAATSTGAASTPVRLEPTFHDSEVVAASLVPRSARSAGAHTRTEAISLLREAAQYFEQAEPSSPVAYMAHKAARWAEMPLHDWLRQVIKSEQELAQLEDLLGIAVARSGGNAS